MDFKIDEEFRQRNRPQSKQERFNLERLIEAEGCLDGSLTVGLIDGDKFLVDGYNTLAVCTEKGVELCRPRCLVFKDRQEALEWIDLRQRARRNLTPEQMQQNRVERIERVVEARAAGKSIRAIAKDEGQSPTTIAEDIRAGLPRSPDKIIGLDGRERLAKRPTPPPPMCPRCSRIGRSLPGCQNCEGLRHPQKARKPEPPDFDDPSDVESTPPRQDAPHTIRCPNCGFEGRFQVPGDDPEPAKKPPTAAKDALEGFPAEFQTPEFRAAWSEWVTHRREKKQTLTPTTTKKQTALLVKLGVGAAIAAIERSIEKGWTGLFPEDTNGTGTSRSAGTVGSGRIRVDEAALEQDRARRAAQKAELEHAGDDPFPPNPAA